MPLKLWVPPLQEAIRHQPKILLVRRAFEHFLRLREAPVHQVPQSYVVAAVLRPHLAIVPAGSWLPPANVEINAGIIGRAEHSQFVCNISARPILRALEHVGMHDANNITDRAVAWLAPLTWLRLPARNPKALDEVPLARLADLNAVLIGSSILLSSSRPGRPRPLFRALGLAAETASSAKHTWPTRVADLSGRLSWPSSEKVSSAQTSLRGNNNLFCNSDDGVTLENELTSFA